MNADDIIELRYKDYVHSPSFPFRANRVDLKHTSLEEKIKKGNDFCDEKGRPNHVLMRNGLNYSYQDKDGKLWTVKWKGF